jgi:hypothetical protein
MSKRLLAHGITNFSVYAGKVKVGIGYLDHSWIEIGGIVVDPSYAQFKFYPVKERLKVNTPDGRVVAVDGATFITIIDEDRGSDLFTIMGRMPFDVKGIYQKQFTYKG